MAKSKEGFFSSISRLFESFRKRKEHDIGNVTTEHFTGSVEGIDSAFELHREDLLRQFGELRGAVAGMEAVLEEKRSRLESLNREEETLLRQRDGAVTLAEQARAAGDTSAYARHEEAFERFETKIERIELNQARVEAEIGGASATLTSSMERVQAMREALEDLSRRRTETLTDFVSNRQLLELDESLHNMESSLDRGPLASVLQANRELSARARLSAELSQPNASAEQDYEEAGRAAISRGRLEALLDQRSNNPDPRPEI